MVAGRSSSVIPNRQSQVRILPPWLTLAGSPSGLRLLSQTPNRNNTSAEPNNFIIGSTNVGYHTGCQWPCHTEGNKPPSQQYPPTLTTHPMTQLNLDGSTRPGYRICGFNTTLRFGGETQGSQHIHRLQLNTVAGRRLSVTSMVRLHPCA